MILTAYDIITALVCCDDELRRCVVEVAYENEATKNNATIFVRDTVMIDDRPTFSINVRGYKNDGRSTSQIVSSLLKYNNNVVTLDLLGIECCCRFWFENAFGAGVDDVGRTIITLDVSVQIHIIKLI